jgi:multiple sugar transport system substrate-binding protein
MKKMTKFSAFVFVIGVLLAPILSAGGVQEPDASGAPAVVSQSPAEMKGQLTFSFWGIPEEVEVQEKITAEFNKIYPNIKVNLDHVSGVDDFNTTIMTRMSGGTGPDVFYMGEVMVPIYSDRGLVEDLLPYAQRDNIDMTDYWPGVLSPCGYNDGHLWAFAKDCGPYFIYYNKAHFDAIGEPYPDGSWTTAKFLEIAKKLTKTDASGKITRYGLAAENGWPTWFALIYKNGGSIMDAQRKRFVYDQNTADILQWYFDLANVHRTATNPDIMVSLGGGAEVDAFKGDLASMVIGGRFMTYFLKDFKGNYGFATFPKAKVTTQPLQFVALGLAKGSKNKEAAWQYIKYYCSRTGQNINSPTGMGLPVMKSVTESGIWMLPGETAQNKNDLLTQFADTKDLPYHPEWARLIDDIYTRHLKEAARGVTTAKNALNAAIAECNKFLEDNGY